MNDGTSSENLQEDFETDVTLKLSGAMEEVHRLIFEVDSTRRKLEEISTDLRTLSFNLQRAQERWLDAIHLQLINKSNEKAVK